MSKNNIKCVLILLVWLLALSAVSAEDNITLGNAAFNDGDFAGAVRAYKAAIEAEKETPSVELLRALGQGQYMANNFDEALETFQKACAADADSGDEVWLARCFIKTQQWTRGQDILLRYLSKNPQNTDGLELLAYLFSQTGRIDEAIGIHKKLLQNYPGQMEYLLALAKAQTSGKYYDDAIDTLEFAERTTTEQTKETGQLLADLYVSKKMYRQAAACYQKIILSSDSPVVDDYYRLGYSYFQTGEFVSAGEAFEKIRQIDPGNIKGPLYLGQIALEKGDTASAWGYYLEAINVNGSSKEARLALAELELGNGQYNNAAEQFSKTIALGEESVAVYYNRVLALMLAEKLPQARTAITEALIKHPRNEQLNGLLDDLIKMVNLD